MLPPGQFFNFTKRKMRENEKNEQEPLQDAEAAQMLKPYGVGIDTHSKFIAVCVLIRKEDKIYRSEKDFGTQWQRLLEAAAWVRAKLPGRQRQ